MKIEKLSKASIGIIISILLLIMHAVMAYSPIGNTFFPIKATPSTWKMMLDGALFVSGYMLGMSLFL
jgi:hypothetical protein